MTTTTTTRRNLLTAAAAAPLAALPALALAAPGDDAELIDLCRQFHAACAFTCTRRSQDEIDDAADAETAILNRLMRIAPATSRGYIAKLRAFARFEDWRKIDHIAPDAKVFDFGPGALLADAVRLFGRAGA